MLHRILVPLDGSIQAEHVLPLARRLAMACRATIHLVRVILPPLSAVPAAAYVSQSTYDTMIAADEGSARMYLEGVRSRLAASGTAAQTEVLTGEAAPQLVLYERELGIDLVALSIRHRGGPARLAMSPVASFLLRHGSAPLLVVSGAADPACLAHAVVPLDGTDEHEEALNAVRELAPAVVQQISLLRVVPDADQELAAERYLSGVAERLSNKGLASVRRRVVAGAAATAIGDLAREGHMVIMATHAHASVTRWLATSVADRVVQQEPAVALLVRTGLPRATSLPRERHEDAQGR